jgi:hypothetical protein
MTKIERGAALALVLAALTLPTAAAHGFTFPWARHGDDAPPADAPRDPSRFTFPYAAHVDIRSGDEAARLFVEKELPAGLPMSEAISRARAAHSACHDTGSDVVCRYWIGDAPDMAPLGEEIWTLTLTPGPDGKLATAAIDRRHAGLPGEEGDRAVFHWQLGE